MIFGLAPMDGITDCAYRYINKRIFDQYNKNDSYELYLWTEFMNVNGYLINPSRVLRHMLTIPTQTPTIAQVYGANTDRLLDACLKLEDDYGEVFSGIELNIGCPSPKVTVGGGGSGMLREKKQTLETIKTLSSRLKLPFSIKTRSGLNESDKVDQLEFIIQASEYCDMITVHGRTLHQSHSGGVDREFIHTVKQKANSKTKILGNGGIGGGAGIGLDSQISQYSTSQTNPGAPLDGLMIGQSAIGNPRIFTDHMPILSELHFWIMEHLHTMMACERYFSSQSPEIPTPDFVLKMLPQKNLPDIIETALAQKDRHFFSVVEFRKYLFNYVKGIPGSKEFKQKVAVAGTYSELSELIHDFFE